MWSVRSLTNSRKISFLATKSVSQFTSTRTPTLPCKWMYEATTPSLTDRLAFLDALAMPFFRRISSAFSRSPPASTKAFLQSIIPAFVFSRSCLTRVGLTSDISVRIKLPGLPGPGGEVRLLFSNGGECRGAIFFLFVGSRINGVYQFLQNDADSANRIVVTGDRVGHEIRIGVGISDRHGRDTEPEGFRNRN